MAHNDNKARFIVRRGAVYGNPGRRSIRLDGWYVYPKDAVTGDQPITIRFRSEAEACYRRDRIEALYERYGW